MKIAIIEIGGSHDECLYSQIKILKSVEGISLSLICDASLKENVSYYNLVDEKLFLTFRKGAKLWIDIYRLWLLCKRAAFDKIILNTAQGSKISKLFCFPFKQRTKFYGILHNTRKIANSHSQKRISRRIEHYFVLNDYLIRNITHELADRVSVFHPVFFPDYPQQKINKGKDDIWICVPGQVELKRRDYKSLFASIEKHGIKEHIKILLLGRYGHSYGDGAYIKQKTAELSVADHFHIWEKFIPVGEFYGMVEKSDYIMPLIHEGDVSEDLYKSQITGAYNIAVGYKKALLVEQTICNKMLSDYKPVTYNKQNLMECINQLGRNNSAELYRHEKWTFDFQRNRYLQALKIDQKEDKKQDTQTNK